MTTMLFFDDQRLFARKNLTRRYGEPKYISGSAYTDPRTSVLCSVHVWRDDNGLYHLFYQGFDQNTITTPLAAISEDCIHWRPRETAAQYLDRYEYPNQFLPTYDAELACVYHDAHDDPSRRLKAFTARYLREELSVADEIWVSPDGLNWKLWDREWSDRHCEPGAGALYSDTVKSHIILNRSGWGRRQLCVYETPDWNTFRPSLEAVQIDSIDPPDLETYGMPSFSYKGGYIGLLWMYHVPSGENSTHYWNGKMDCQLTYSLNGVHWQRSLRDAFIGNDLPETAGMVFPSAVTQMEDGSLLIHAASTPREHGHFKEGGSVLTYRLREDGFIRLCAGAEGGSLCTRQLLVGGKIYWNLAAKHATVAAIDVAGKPLEGFGHEDCVPFAGDDVHWEPQYRDGRTLESLKGKVIAMELRMEDGSVYSYSGELTPMMNTEAMRYEKFGRV